MRITEFTATSRERPGRLGPASGWVLAAVMLLAGAGCSGGGEDGAPTSTLPAPPTVPTVANPSDGPGTPAVVSKMSLWTADRPRLRGVNIHQARAFEDGTRFDGSMESHYRQEDFDRLAALGANYVNVSHPGLFDERPPYGFDAAIAANLDGLLAMIERADMFAVISFRTGPGRSELTFVRDELEDPDPFFTVDDLDESLWDSAAAQAAWVEMWRRTVERYRGHPAVAGYDLMVEPNSNEVVGERHADFDPWDPAAFAGRFGGSLADWNGLYPRIVLGVREMDGDTPVLVGGNGYSAAEWLPELEPVDDPAIVYTLHQYAPYDYTHQYPDAPVAYGAAYNGKYLEGLLASADAFAAAHDVPLAVNEMGVVPYAPGAAAFLADQIDLLEERGWNWAIWQLPAADHPAGDTFDFRLGPEALGDVLRGYWARNEVRPSTFVSGSRGPEAAGRRDLLTAVDRWLYLIDVNLQQSTVDRIAASEHDLVVLDFIPSEADNEDYPMAGVVTRFHTAQHPKLVLAYLDVGEAEDYRSYWQDGWTIGDPDWIVAADPDGWEGNFPVAYWRPEWRDIWLGDNGIIAAVVAAGFDGVYLDWVEGYSSLDVEQAARRDGVAPDEEMVAWVSDLASAGRAANPDFLVIGQNAVELAVTDEAYRVVIDAVAQEQVWYDGGADGDPPGDCPLPRTDDDVASEEYEQSLSLSPGCLRLYEDYEESTLHTSSEEYLRHLTWLHATGLPVFTVDYAEDPATVVWVLETSRDLGFTPFVGGRALDRFEPPG